MIRDATLYDAFVMNDFVMDEIAAAGLICVLRS